MPGSLSGNCAVLSIAGQMWRTWLAACGQDGIARGALQVEFFRNCGSICHQPLPFLGDHADRNHKIGVIRDHHRGFEPILPCIVQQMDREIHVRTLLFHGVGLGDYRVRDRCPGAHGLETAHRQALMNPLGLVAFPFYRLFAWTFSVA